MQAIAHRDEAFVILLSLSLDREISRELILYRICSNYPQIDVMVSINSDRDYDKYIKSRIEYDSTLISFFFFFCSRDTLPQKSYNERGLRYLSPLRPGRQEDAASACVVETGLNIFWARVLHR